MLTQHFDDPPGGLSSAIGLGKDLGDDDLLGHRTILFAGGLTIALSGLGVLWSLRTMFVRPKIAEDTRRFIEEANRARQTYYGRRSGDSE